MKYTFCIALLLLLSFATALKKPEVQAQMSGSLKYYKRFLKGQSENAIANEAGKAANDLGHISLPNHLTKHRKHKHPFKLFKKSHGKHHRPTYHMRTPQDFDERQGMRQRIYEINHDIHVAQRQMHLHNIDQEKHVYNIQRREKNYVANIKQANTEGKEREQALKYQINHDEKFKEAFERRSMHNTLEAAKTINHDAHKRLLKTVDFDNDRARYYHDKEHEHYEQLVKLENEDREREDARQRTDSRLKEEIKHAQLEAYKVRGEGKKKLEHLKAQENAAVAALGRGEELKARRGKNNHLEKVKKEIIAVGEAHESV